MIWFVILVSNISFFHLFFSPSPSRNWYPGAQSKLLRFPMTVRASRCMARIVQHVLPSSTNVGMCLTTVLGALDRYCLMKNSYSMKRIESIKWTPEIFEIDHYRRSRLTTIYPPTHSFAKKYQKLLCPLVWEITRDRSFSWTLPNTSP